MKIGILNFSGNVGKTTVAKYLLQRKMQCEVYSIESINSSSLDGDDVTKITAKDFSELQTALLLNDDLIVDIGSSNAESLLKEISTYSGSQNDFDFFVIPTLPQDKQILDTISTIVYLLHDLNIPKEKIRVIYNFAESPSSISYQFARVESTLKNLGIEDSSSFIIQTDYFAKLDEIKNSSSNSELVKKASDLDFMADYQETIQKNLNQLKSDFKNADSEEKLKIKDKMVELAQLVQLSRLAIGVRENLDSAYNLLFKNK